MLKLCDPVRLGFEVDFCFSVDFVVGVQFLLKVNDRLVSLIESVSQGNHDVSLFDQKLLVAIYLGLVLFKHFSFSLNLFELLIVLISDGFLLLLEGLPELCSLFHFLSSVEHLRVHHPNLFF